MKQVTINNSTLSLTVLNYGAVIQRLIFTDKHNHPTNTVVGLDEASDYLDDSVSLGACVGRFAGRISGGGFTLGDRHYELYQEDGVHLHGGREGFAKKYWDFEEISEGPDPKVVLKYISPDMEEGYPGTLTCRVIYELKKSSLRITHEAVTDRPTIVNLTNHSYFRLDDADQVNDYQLRLNCPELLETDEKLLPTGKLLDVRNTSFDFLNGKKIGPTRLDTPFVCERNQEFVGEIYSEKSGIRMRISSNQPAVVVYTPLAFPAICFETQNFPDAPNNGHFPSSLLLPGETYSNSAVFEFDLLN